jgi:hypothetical protein
MLFVTFHGGKPGGHSLNNNVHAYDTSGKLISPSVLEDTEGVVLDELRCIHRVGKLLYVADSNRTQNSVLCYRGSGTSYKFIGKLVSHETCKGVLHPFDFTFDDAGHCYVSSQDTNVVTRLIVSKHEKTGKPAHIASALPKGEFLAGTFVASSKETLSKPPTTVVPPPAGLQYSGKGAKAHSVRGVLWADDALYVADEPAGRVKVYNHKGKFLGQSNKVESPVHLVKHHGSLYVSGGNDVLAAELPKEAGDFTLSAVPGLRVKNSSGMAFTPKGHLYVASRTENVILKFDSSFKPMKFDCKLPDNPECLLHI